MVHSSDSKGELFVFAYGVVVFWGCASDEQERYLKEFVPFTNQRFDMPFIDEFTFSLDAPHFSVKYDHLELPNNDV